MESFFANALSLQNGEGSRVTSLLTMGFLMGISSPTLVPVRATEGIERGVVFQINIIDFYSVTLTITNALRV